MRSAIIRIKTDLTDLKYDDSDQITTSVELQADNPLLVKVCVVEDEGDIFEITMQFPTDYPVKKQKFFFINLLFFLVFITYNHNYGRRKLSRSPSNWKINDKFSSK
jgi:ubiquitin-protein ligase